MNSKITVSCHASGAPSHRVKDAKRLGVRIGNWLTVDQSKTLLGRPPADESPAQICLGGRCAGVELRGARDGAGGHRLRVLQRIVALEGIGDAGCAHRMTADAFDAWLARAAEPSGNRPVSSGAVPGETSGVRNRGPSLSSAMPAAAMYALRYASVRTALRVPYRLFRAGAPSAPTLAKVDHHGDQRTVAQACERV
jgi:hypothetical protein